MRRDQDTAIEALMEQLIANGAEDMASVFSGLFDLAMRIEREQFLEAGHYETHTAAARLCQWRQAQAAGHPGWHGHRKRAQDGWPRRAVLSAIA